jgi:hypothetical protein
VTDVEKDKGVIMLILPPTHFKQTSAFGCGGTKKNSVALVCERTMPTERPPLFGEVVSTFSDRGVEVLSSFKGHCHSMMNSKILHNKEIPLSIHDIAECVITGRNRTMTLANIYSTIKKTGIFPFDPNVFIDDDFMISEITNSVMQEHERPT